MLTEEQIAQNYATYIKFLKGYIHRDGIDALVDWLNQSDMAYAPASTKYHGAYPGGLVEHCLDVFKRMFTLMKFDYNDDIPYEKESIAIVSLLHDIDKVNKYEYQMRNRKNANGEWIQEPFYAIRSTFDKLIFGSHAENSAFILSRFFKLSYEETMAVLCHMGGANYEEKDVVRVEIDAHRISALAYYLHEADYYATCRLEYERPTTEQFISQFPYLCFTDNDNNENGDGGNETTEGDNTLQVVTPEE